MQVGANNPPRALLVKDLIIDFLVGDAVEHNLFQDGWINVGQLVDVQATLAGLVLAEAGGLFGDDPVAGRDINAESAFCASRKTG